MEIYSSINARWLWTLAAILLIVVFYMFHTYYHNGLNRYPGPTLANFTLLWYRQDVKSNRHPQHLTELHRKYGDVVRIGPNSLSIYNPAYFPLIYGTSQGYLKSEMYDPFAPRVNGKRLDSSLSVRDPKAHHDMHKPIANAYSLTNVLEHEPLIDQMIVKLLGHLRAKTEEQNEIDIGLWMRLYVFDVIWQVTMSDTLGFMEAGGDVAGFFEQLHANIDRSGLLVTMPWTAYLLKHNPITSYFSKNSTMFPAWTASRVQKRLSDRAEKSIDTLKYEGKDFLDRFIDEAYSSPGSEFNFSQAMNWTLTNNPSKKTKLDEELEAAKLNVPVSWAQSQKLPYLDAVIKESLRIHPPIGLCLERKAGGLQMPDGYILPPGTNVRMNAWVINKQAIFGEHVEEFIPERWLRSQNQSEGDFQERLKLMKRADLVFGSGARACTGKWVSMLEIYKVVVSLFVMYDFEMVDARDEWTVVSRWTVRQDGICFIIRERGG